VCRGEATAARRPEMASILIKRYAFQVRQWDTFWLSETPHSPGSKSWGSVFPRTVTWVEINHLASGRLLIFVNTHFDYEPSAIRESARALKEWIDGAIDHHPVLVTGDFNAGKTSPAYHQMTSGDPLLVDVFRSGTASDDNEGTFHGYGMQIPSQSIDWMLASDHFAVLNATVDRYREANLFSSDHYPITATIDWMNPA
jgi:endonuclease/exonuclease/phosphatase family metal-dependent hydrolase